MIRHQTSLSLKYLSVGRQLSTAAFCLTSFPCFLEIYSEKRQAFGPTGLIICWVNEVRLLGVIILVNDSKRNAHALHSLNAIIKIIGAVNRFCDSLNSDSSRRAVKGLYYSKNGSLSTSKILSRQDQ